MRRSLLILLIGACGANLLPAQLRITGLDDLASKAKESVDITLDSSMLQMAGGFLASSGKETDKVRGILAGLKAITVRSFQFKETGQYRLEDLEPIRAQLRTPGWNKIVSVQSQDEISEVYTRMDQGKVVGLAIIAAEPRELTVVAIDGTMDLNNLSALKGLGVPAIPTPATKGKQK